MKNILPDVLKKRNKFPEIKSVTYKHAPILRALSIILMGLLAAIILATAFFVHKRVIGTINQINSIILLQSELNIEPIDFEKFKKVEKRWSDKHSTSTTHITRDPFNPAIPEEENNPNEGNKS